MSRMQRHDRHACRSGRGPRTANSHHRHLRFEPLEDRRLLATITVNNNLDITNGNVMSIGELIADDGGDGISLREAVMAANSTAGADEVLFAAALSGATLLLGGTEIEITETLTIDATLLAENFTIDAQQYSRSIHFSSSSGDLTLAALTLKNGSPTGTADEGGGIRFASGTGTLTLISSNVSANSTSDDGGGIFTVSTLSNVTLINSIVSDNSTAGMNAHGGGIFALGDVMLTSSIVSGNTSGGAGGGIITLGDAMLTNSTVSGNTAYGNGGGGIALAGGITLIESTVSGNSTEGRYGRGGGIFAGANVTLTSSTVSGNSTEGDDAPGGGIFTNSGGAVTLINSTVSGNSTAGRISPGGGIFTSDGAVIVTDSTVSGNSTAGIGSSGGGIYADGNVTLTNSTVSGNYTAGYGARGGGIVTRFFGAVTLTLSTVSGNSSTGRGGGIYAFGAVTLLGSTISGNATTGDNARGGGIFAYGDVTLTSSTISGNSTAFAAGGGILANGDVSIAWSTIAGNTTTGSNGGGLYVLNSPFQSLLTIRNSIVAGNTLVAGTIGPDFIPDPEGVLIVEYSVIGDNNFTGLAEAQSPDANGNLIGQSIDNGGSGIINPLLGPLANNGGPTMTHALSPGSPAIDMGDPNFDPDDPDGNPMTDDAMPYDQRGEPFVRVYDGDGAGGPHIDIGAFERQPNPLPGDYNFDGKVSAADYTTWRNTLDSTNDLRADGDENGQITQNDYQVWKDNYGNTLPPPGTAATAEEVEVAAAVLLAEPPVAPAVAPERDAAAGKGTIQPDKKPAASNVGGVSDADFARQIERTIGVRDASHRRFLVDRPSPVPINENELLLLATSSTMSERRDGPTEHEVVDAVFSGEEDEIDLPKSLALALDDWP